MKLLEKTIKGITPIDSKVIEEAQMRLDNLLKPQGSLGELEEIAKKLASITGNVKNKINKKTIIVMAADNGIVQEKVTSFPKDLSLLVGETMLTGLSGVAVLAKHAGAELRLIDIGIDGDFKNPNIINRKIRKGTSNFAKGPAMNREEAITAMEIGIEETLKAIDDGADLIGTGEIGIGNTTTSSAVLHAFTGANLNKIVGRGAGLSDEGLKIKKSVIKNAIALNMPNSSDPIDVISKVGGFDIAGMTGIYIAAAYRKIPVIIDGFISGVAAVTAARLNENCTDYMFASHLSIEPGALIINEILGLTPMLKMKMRLGEGTGCALAFNIIEAATCIMNNMGTFDDIKI